MASRKSDREWNPDPSFLLPPSPTDWLPGGHLADVTPDVVEALDCRPSSPSSRRKDPRGERPYDRR